MSGANLKAYTEGATRYLGERVLTPRCMYLIRRPERSASGAVRGYSYVTFDDPTGGAPEGRVDIAAGETPGPVRTLLAFTSEEITAEYLHEELRGVGEIYQCVINTAEMGRLFRLMLGGKISWFTFDRYPGSRHTGG